MKNIALPCPAVRRLAIATIIVLTSVAGANLSTRATAQETGPLQSGEAYVTRFSGATKAGDGAVIDLKGTVGGIVDLRSPGQPPQGQHWLNEPQHDPVTAGEVGQVFGVAIDDAKNIYLTATSAFGLHRTADNKGWMPGMWGPDAGPGTVWKIDAATGRPAIFARIGVNGRRNTGAALGNIAYDKWHHQLYVSDLETGLIHRLRLSDGADLGQFDQGMTGRASFLDAESDQQKSLPTVAFDPNTAARITDCPTPFVKTPACWNFADFRRRVWGLGVRKDAKTGEVRLYYATWASEGFENPAFASANADEKHNAIWSVAITADGDFDKTSVRKEFVLPDFFTKPDDIARFGYSRPVADIAFCKCIDQNVMLVAERGGVRNLGLDDENAFAFPHQSRVLRYELDKDGHWQVQGRYDVGYYDRKSDGSPYIRANASGGVDFGFSYDTGWRADPRHPDRTAWMTGGSLCSPQAPCFSPDIGRSEDGSYVAGAQGTPLFAFSDLLPEAATQPYPVTGPATPATGPRQSYLFDTDANVDADNNVIADELTRNDSSKIGDIAIFQDCAGMAPPLKVVEEQGDIEEPPIVDEAVEGTDAPDLEKVKTGPAQCVEGSICTFSVTITNRGTGVWSGPLWELDTLPPGATLFDYAPQPQWVCTQTGGQASCMHEWVTLNPGEAVSLTMDVQLARGVTGPVDNCIEDVWLPSWDPNDPAVTLVLEQALSGLGYAVGPIDGLLDIVTMNAISNFQADNGLPVTGLPDEAVLGLMFGGSAGLVGDADPANDRSCHTVDVTPLPPPPPPVAAAVPDLQIRKIQRSALCRPGELCNFELRFINRGPVAWTGRPQIRDTLPAGATFVAATAPATCTQAGRILTCRWPRRITMGLTSTRRIVVTLRMPANLRPGVQNCARIPDRLNPNDPNPNNNNACIRVRVPPRPAPDLQTLKTQTTGECAPGKDCTFDLWFINRGPGTWKGRPRLTDTLPRGAKLQKQSAPWTCRQNGSRVACSRNAVTLRPWRGVKVSVTIRLPANLAQGARNCVAIDRTQETRNDPVPQNNEQCVPIRQAAPEMPVEPPHEEVPATPAVPVAPPPPPPPTFQAGLEKTQLGPCKPGSSCLFELKLTNRGITPWTGKPTIADVLPTADIRLGAWTPSMWRCHQDGRVVRCEHPNTTMTPNEHLSVMLTLRLPAHFHPGPQNCAVVDRPGVDPIHSTDRACVTIDTATPGFTPHPPTVVSPGAPPAPPEVHCPAGTVRRGNQCIKYSCPRGYVLRGTKCYSTRRTCPPGYVLRGTKCYRIIRTCPPGYVRIGNSCVRFNVPPPHIHRPTPHIYRPTPPIHRPTPHTHRPSSGGGHLH
ncbi:MAG: peptidoglycan-binding protein [Pseudolabrys sp.]